MRAKVTRDQWDSTPDDYRVTRGAEHEAPHAIVHMDIQTGQTVLTDVEIVDGPVRPEDCQHLQLVYGDDPATGYKVRAQCRTCGRSAAGIGIEGAKRAFLVSIIAANGRGTPRTIVSGR